jgi:hypothetical protein
MKKFIAITILLCCFVSLSLYSKDAPRSYYQLQVYHLKNKVQEAQLDSYLKNAYVPALHKAGVKQVGVFKLVDVDTVDLRVYVFIPFSTFEQVEAVTAKLQADSHYAESGKDFIQTPFNAPGYVRIESILLRAFSGMPTPSAPKLKGAKNERIYELRSYESASEKYAISKIRQFNYGSAEGTEMSIFTRLNFNPVFYGEVLFGSKMPNLMYMTSFENKADRDDHWKAFNTDAFWLKLRALPEYQNTVSKNVQIFLYPAEYSDF